MISEVHNIDCRKGLITFNDGFFNIGYFDTQYGIGEDGKKSKSRSGFVKQKDGSNKYVQSNHAAGNWDNEIMPAAFWELAKLKTVNQIIFGVNYIHQNISFITYKWSNKPPRRNEYEAFIKDNPYGFIIWDKVNGTSDFSDCELIWTSFDEPSFIKYYMWSGMMQAADAINGTIQQGNKALNQKRIHPTEKPIPLNRWLLQRYSKYGGIIADTHSGSQSLRIAAYQEGVNYYGWETHTPYFDAGNKRFELFKQQGKLFAA